MNDSGAVAEMPKYQCHKQVHALKIDSLKPQTPDDGTLLLTPEDAGFAPFILSADFVSKHAPQTGGYYVVYDDGYKSFSPAKVFEDGYTLVL